MVAVTLVQNLIIKYRLALLYQFYIKCVDLFGKAIV